MVLRLASQRRQRQHRRQQLLSRRQPRHLRSGRPELHAPAHVADRRAQQADGVRRLPDQVRRAPVHVRPGRPARGGAAASRAQVHRRRQVDVDGDEQARVRRRLRHERQRLSRRLSAGHPAHAVHAGVVRERLARRHRPQHDEPRGAAGARDLQLPLHARVDARVRHRLARGESRSAVAHRPELDQPRRQRRSHRPLPRRPARFSDRVRHADAPLRSDEGGPRGLRAGFVDAQAVDHQPGAAVGVLQLRDSGEGRRGRPLRAGAIVRRGSRRAELEEHRAALQHGVRPDRRREDCHQGEHQQVQPRLHDRFRKPLRSAGAAERHAQLVGLRLQPGHIHLLGPRPADQRRRHRAGQRNRSEQQSQSRHRRHAARRSDHRAPVRHRVQPRRRAADAARCVGDCRVVSPRHLQSRAAAQHAGKRDGLRVVHDAEPAQRRAGDDLQPESIEAGARRPARYDGDRSIEGARQLQRARAELLRAPAARRQHVRRMVGRQADYRLMRELRSEYFPLLRSEPVRRPVPIGLQARGQLSDRVGRAGRHFAAKLRRAAARGELGGAGEPVSRRAHAGGHRQSDSAGKPISRSLDAARFELPEGVHDRQVPPRRRP